MNPDNITLETMNRSFEYEKLAREIDSIDDVKTLRNVAKSYAKLFLKQKETVASIAKMKMDDQSCLFKYIWQTCIAKDESNDPKVR